MKRNDGFTLIEAMIVTAIIAILVAIAVPAYTDYVRKANRGEAQSMLLQWANNQEVWRASHTSYTDQAGDITYPSHNRFEFSVVADTNTYELTATANTIGAQDTDEERGVPCAVMTLNQIGLKTPERCWQE